MNKAAGEPGPAELFASMMAAGTQTWLEFARASAMAMLPPGESAAPVSAPAPASAAAPAPASPAAPGPAATDRRFAAEPWRKDPAYAQLADIYVSFAEQLQDWVNLAPVDDRTKATLSYAARQYTEAMSPANFLLTNPEAQQLARESDGRSLMEGMTLFFQDLAKGRVSMSDESAFEVGRNVAITPGAVIYENEVMQLIQYAAATAEVYERPLVIIPPCINKFYILDLQPQNSFVRYVVGQGHTVFLVSWRNATASQGHLVWDDYIRDGVMRALEVARAVCGVSEVNTLGFCVGGTLLASALALRAATAPRTESSMTLLTTFLDFADTGELGLMVSEQSVAAREAAIGGGGVMRGSELAHVFASLRANDLIWQYVANSYLKGKAPPAFDLLAWNADATNLPGPMFCWYVRNTYLQNRLRMPGGTVQCGQPVDLSKIKLPTYLYASLEDHIVPWRSAYASLKLLGADSSFVLGASGHIAGVINPPEKQKRNFWINAAEELPADDWLESAEKRPGSWWPHWARWLSQHAGWLRPARQQLGNHAYTPIEPAPGRYVRAKAE